MSSPARTVSTAVRSLLDEHGVSMYIDKVDKQSQWCKFRELLISFCHDQELRRVFYRFLKTVRLLFACEDRHSYVNVADMPIVLHFLLQHQDVNQRLCDHLPRLSALCNNPPLSSTRYRPPDAGKLDFRSRGTLQEMEALFRRSVYTWRTLKRPLRQTHHHQSVAARKRIRHRAPHPASPGGGGGCSSPAPNAAAVAAAAAATDSSDSAVATAATPPVVRTSSSSASRILPISIDKLPPSIRRHLMTQRRCVACGVLSSPVPRQATDDDLASYQSYFCNPQCLPPRPRAQQGSSRMLL